MEEQFLEGGNFGNSFMDAIRKKYPDLYEMIDKKIVYLDWENSTLENAKIGNGEVSIYTKESDNYIGTFSCKFKIYHNEYKEWYPNEAIKSSLKFNIKQQ